MKFSNFHIARFANIESTRSTEIEGKCCNPARVENQFDISKLEALLPICRQSYTLLPG